MCVCVWGTHGVCAAAVTSSVWRHRSSNRAAGVSEPDSWKQLQLLLLLRLFGTHTSFLRRLHAPQKERASTSSISTAQAALAAWSPAHRTPGTCLIETGSEPPSGHCEYYPKYCKYYQHGVPAVLGATAQYYWITHVWSVCNQSACAVISTWMMILVPSVARWSRDEHILLSERLLVRFQSESLGVGRKAIQNQCRAPLGGRFYEDLYSDDFIVELLFLTVK